jgi:hypothetical protein
VVEILDPIAPGLEKDAFFQRLQEEIEAATGRLVAEAMPEGDAPARNPVSQNTPL